MPCERRIVNEYSIVLAVITLKDIFIKWKYSKLTIVVLVGVIICKNKKKFSAYIIMDEVKKKKFDIREYKDSEHVSVIIKERCS